MSGWGIDYANLGAFTLGVVLLGVGTLDTLDRLEYHVKPKLKVFPKLASRGKSSSQGASPQASFESFILPSTPTTSKQSPICTAVRLVFLGHGADRNDHTHSLHSPSQYCPFCRPDCQVSTTHFPPGANCRMSDQTFHFQLMHTAPTKITTSATF